MRVLLIEDNHDLAANLGEFLESESHSVDYASDGLIGLYLAQTNSYDVVVLDLGLPGLDGIDVCKQLRRESRSALPILILTARDSERDTISGLDAGGDDYLVKPVSLAVLGARLRALQRRSTGSVGGQLQVADLILDLHIRTARRGLRKLDLTPSGFRLLERLMAASPALVSRQDVEYLLWGDQPPDNDGALRTHIHSLRQAVDKDESVKLLHTVHGLGYRLGLY